jgi:PPOX class probable F420-dependent enzyme
MPGYGTLPANEGTGLLPWSWAEERLAASHDYWLATTRPDGRPHVMPVWGAWFDGALWFSSSLQSRKARNLEADPRASATTDDAQAPVVVEGAVERVTTPAQIAVFLGATNAKYDVSYDIDFLDPAVNGTYRLEVIQAVGLLESDFEGSPTRWRFRPAST